MRAGSLSHPRVIETLNRYFVAVYTSNEDFREQGRASSQEKQALERIHQEGYAAKLSVGTVHAYVLTPEGKTLDALHVADAFQPAKLLAMLDRAVQKFTPTAGQTLVKPQPVVPPKAQAGELLCHLVSRYLEREGDDYRLLTYDLEKAGNWGDFPAQEWVTLSSAQWQAFLPPSPVTVGKSWEIPTTTSEPLLTHFYPPTENNDLKKNRFEEQRLTATVVAIKAGIVQVRLEGKLRMQHPFYHKPDEQYVEATLLGYLEVERASRRLRSLHLVTDRATYGGKESRLHFGVALQKIPSQ